MLSYRHAFHAGNFADVFKHLILIQLIRALQRKPTPFRLLDTHAGAGDYDLQSEPACKNREFDDGIGRLWRAQGVSAELEDYLARVRAHNGPGPLRRYPGSPRIARALLRPDDRLVLVELHTSEYPRLKAEFAGDRQVAVHHLDGYQALRALLPPKERRGLVLLDPSYEQRTEFEAVLAGLQTLQRRWPTGIAAVWYPIIDRDVSHRFHAGLRRLNPAPILCAELGLSPADVPRRMNGCGMIIMNPPWQLDAMLDRLLPELRQQLDRTGQGWSRLEWLIPAAAGPV
jgi:23S rRNA (adenine2030-N6)-methyltransferase